MDLASKLVLLAASVTPAAMAAQARHFNSSRPPLFANVHDADASDLAINALTVEQSNLSLAEGNDSAEDTFETLISNARPVLCTLRTPSSGTLKTQRKDSGPMRRRYSSYHVPGLSRLSEVECEPETLSSDLRTSPTFRNSIFSRGGSSPVYEPRVPKAPTKSLGSVVIRGSKSQTPLMTPMNSPTKPNDSDNASASVGIYPLPGSGITPETILKPRTYVPKTRAAIASPVFD